MSAEWKKIILSGSEAQLSEISSSGGISLSTEDTIGVITPNQDDKILVVDALGDVYTRLVSQVGDEGSNVNSFVTMSINGTDTVFTSIVNDTLNLTSSLGDPLTISGDQSSDPQTITITVATASRETIEDTTDDLLAGPHEGLTITYADNGANAGIFTIVGTATTSFADTTGQTGVDFNESSYLNDAVFANALNLPIPTLASASELRKEDSVQFTNITSSLSAGSHNGNISQTTDVSGFIIANGNYGLPLTSPGEWISASALHIVDNTHIETDLTMSGNFIFQGFAFDDHHVLTHDESNIFGSGSMPAALASVHQFTGSISITGSGITLQQSNSFNGNGSGITNISLGSLSGVDGNDLLTGSSQIASEISGAFQFISPTLRTASLTDGTVSAITASGTAVTSGFPGLASGDQIYNRHSTVSSSFIDFVASNYVVSASFVVDTSALHIATTGNIGSTENTNILQSVFFKMHELTTITATEDDVIMFSGSSGVGMSNISASLLGSITGSSAGTVTNIGAGSGISVTNPTGYSSTTVVDTTVDIALSGSNNNAIYTLNSVPGHTTSNLLSSADGISLNPLLNIEKITATSGSFSYLKVSDVASLTDLQTETVKIEDNFIWLNHDATGDPDDPDVRDAGISINRGDTDDANLFWNETHNRWSINKADLQTGTPTSSMAYAHDSDLVITTFNETTPDITPTYGGATYGRGNIHINKTAGAQEVWIYA